MSAVALNSLRWTRARARLQNRRAAAAREHPLWILHGLLMFALPPDAAGAKPLAFRPAGSVGRHIELAREYPLDVFFPGHDLPRAYDFLERLARHLQKPNANFDLLAVGLCENRSFDKLLAEASPWPPHADEVCLDFFTPCAYTPDPARRPWELPAEKLGALLAHRARHLLGEELAFDPAPWRALRTLCPYWRFEQHAHPSRSGPGAKTIAGNVGPLFLRGTPAALAAVRPWLLLGAELGCGLKLGSRGHYQLRFDHALFDPLLARPETFLRALDDLAQRSDLPDDFNRRLGDPDRAAASLAAELGAGQWQPAVAAGFRLAKTSGLGDRLAVQIPPRDRLVHHALHAALQPVFDRLFEPQSHGFRPGRGVQTARQLVQRAWADGLTIALQADIESFFDSIDWDRLDAQLDAALPRADVRTRAALHALVRTPTRLHKRPVRRVRGLLQGSPLSPLLANLYLDPFDEEMTRRGCRLVRYADDFIVLCRDEADARAALDHARDILTPLGLRLSDDKTAITPFDTGFTFLGLHFGGGLAEDWLEDTALERTLFLRHPHAWVGVDHDAVTVREAGRLLARLPFRRVSEIVLLGAGGVSQKLVERCAQRGIALSFCTAAGRLQNVLWRHDQSHYRLAAAQAARHAALPPAERLACARLLVSAKLHNYLAWFRARPEAQLRPAIDACEAGLRLLTDATTLDALRGVEGLAARDVFRTLNDRAPAPFHSLRREPHTGLDLWNILLDFAYSLLFQRLNTLVRLRGLDPFLGLLHSPDARYESLVCDLQEPFRARCDRFLQKVLNRGQMKAEDFEPDPLTGPSLTRTAAARFIELFAQELDTRLAHEPATWGKTLEGQVRALERWARGEAPFRVFFSRPDDAAPPGPRPPPDTLEAGFDPMEGREPPAALPPEEVPKFEENEDPGADHEN
jgi:CRISPR-associated protein Cas1